MYGNEDDARLHVLNIDAAAPSPQHFAAPPRRPRAILNAMAPPTSRSPEVTTPHVVRAPARIDLAGGTLDIWPICLIERGAVTLNLAIDRLATARVQLREDGRTLLAASDRGIVERRAAGASTDGTALPLHAAVAEHLAPGRGIEIRTRSGVPAGSGLGGSSTLVVAMIRAVARATGRRLAAPRILRIAADVEAQVLGVPTGVQDHVAAVYGGLSAITYPPGGAVRTSLRADTTALARRLVLVYTGKPHVSAVNNWAITRRYIEGDADVRRHLTAVAAAARRMRDALHGGDLDAVADAMDAEWRARKQLTPRVTTRDIERLGRAARKEGARAMKVCGAGGGGCVVLFTEKGRRGAIERVARQAGHRVLRFRPYRGGAG